MTPWIFDLPTALGVVVVLALYLLGTAGARRQGTTWPVWRTLCFALLGLGGIVLCTMSPLAAHVHQHLWALATQVSLLTSIVPVLISLGDPLGLIRAALPPGGVRAWDRLLASPVVRILTFPVVSAVLVTVALTVLFFSPLLESALRHGLVMDLVQLGTLLVGCLAALPLLGAELLPEWVTDPLKLLFAFVDGLVDALPGILVMTTSTPLAGGWFVGRAGDPNWDVHVAGALMLALSEVVALPLFFMVFFRWAIRETSRREPVDDDEPELSRPWWEEEEDSDGIE